MSTAIDTQTAGKSPAYICGECGRPFETSHLLRTLLPLLVPQRCSACASRPPRPARPPAIEDVLDGPARGPGTGVFVAAVCYPDPGPGAWAAVRVVNGAVLRESAAAEPWTTAARMGLRALIEGLRLFGPREPLTLYAEDRAAVMTLREWGPAWQRNGWRVRGGKGRPSNLDLVQEAVSLYQARVNARVELASPDAAATWSHYAHALAAWRLFEECETGTHREAG